MGKFRSCLNKTLSETPKRLQDNWFEHILLQCVRASNQKVSNISLTGIFDLEKTIIIGYRFLNYVLTF